MPNPDVNTRASAFPTLSRLFPQDFEDDTRQSPPKPETAPTTAPLCIGPSCTTEKARASAGDMKWLHEFNDSQKLRAIGLNPDRVDRDELSKLFGRNSDSVLAANTHKENPERYFQLKQAALALDLYGQ